ncbi:MutS-related protein [Streptomyces noursei]
MSFPSILFPTVDDEAAAAEAGQREPDYFPDLHLDQIVAALTEGREEYDLAPFFRARLRSVPAVLYRHEVFRDLQDDVLLAGLRHFAKQMSHVRDRLTRATWLRHRYQQRSWNLQAAAAYLDAVVALEQTLRTAHLRSHGLRDVAHDLAQYTRSQTVAELRVDTERVQQLLASVRYCLRLDGARVKVTRYDAEADFSAEVVAAFEKFKQAEVKDYRATFRDFPDMNHVEEAILDRVALLYPAVFEALDDYHARHATFVDPGVETFDREAQFYLSYRALIAPLTAAGLALCLPRVSDRSKQIAGHDVFDIALAHKRVGEHLPVVPNDFRLQDLERIFVVSGPNQGGKTTFARTVGQLHHLAALGCPVPGRQAQLFLCDQMFTHFERGEDQDLGGKLRDDLVRVHDILERATGDSILIMNEVFTSTTLRDAVVLGTHVLEKICAMDALCVCVTFVDELARLGPATVSMVSTVVPGNPPQRTYRIVRQPADGLSYAMSLAQSYGLTSPQLLARITAHPAESTVR